MLEPPWWRNLTKDFYTTFVFYTSPPRWLLLGMLTKFCCLLIWIVIRALRCRTIIFANIFYSWACYLKNVADVYDACCPPNKMLNACDCKQRITLIWDVLLHISVVYFHYIRIWYGMDVIHLKMHSTNTSWWNSRQLPLKSPFPPCYHLRALSH